MNTILISRGKGYMDDYEKIPTFLFQSGKTLEVLKAEYIWYMSTLIPSHYIKEDSLNTLFYINLLLVGLEKLDIKKYKKIIKNMTLFII